MSYQFSTTTSLSDETYLESFVESISATLPNELRRNLEHLRDLDNASCKTMEDWRERQDVCLKDVGETLLRVLCGEASAAAAAAAAAAAVDDDDCRHGGDDSSYPGDAGEIPARGTKRKQREKSPEKSPEKKAACVKCRERKVQCNGKQQYCVLHLNKASAGVRGDSDDSDDNRSVKKQKVLKDGKVGKQDGVRENDQGENMSPLSQNEISEFLQKRGAPTSEEIRITLESHNSQYTSQRNEITKLYHDLQRFSDEKINTAYQLKSMVDMALGRLNRDLENFEKDLGIDNISATAAGSINMGGGIGGITGDGLGMVGHNAHVASGGVMTASGVGTVCNNSCVTSRAPSANAPTAAAVNNPSSLRRSSFTTTATLLPPTPPMQQPYPSMRGTVPPSPKSVQTSNLAAIQVTSNSPDWILAKILSHEKSAKMYTLSDEDVQSNQIYNIPEKQVVVLKGTERNKWNRGDVVYAVYPDTTSFYHATVSTPPLNGYVMVQFKDDWDANGVTHEKAVLMAHVMKVPPGRK